MDDVDFTPGGSPPSGGDARPWHQKLDDAEKAFSDYHVRCDRIDELYADLSLLAKDNRDRQFQLFWANVEVLKPSIYARPPIPVVVPKFKDRRPLYRVSSELLERCSVVAFDLADVDGVMRLVRDDLAVVGRGVPWVRYETKAESGRDYECCAIEHLDRKDFRHEPARKWAEVGWVARRAWLNKKKMEARFSKHSGDAYLEAEYVVRRDDKDNGAATEETQCGVWEIWSKDENKVVWVAPGCNTVLDEGEPHLKLEGFYPCPRPAYSTVQRGSLIPVPDMAYYKDQLEEINELTGRIHALAPALRVRGFYPAGSAELGDAIESALKSNDDRQVMVPVSNWAAFGGAGGEPVIWLPVKEVAEVVAGLVELRRQIIDDVYQIMGLSDIMRGATEKDETATAQQIKVQYGSVRIRDKQAELVRVARDIERICAEIIAENFSQKTMLAMSQMEIPTDADIRRQIETITKNAEEQFQQHIQSALSNPETAQKAQADPQQAQQIAGQLQQQIVGQAQQAIEKEKAKPTIEAVVKFLRDQRIRPFVLDIETDSTIQPDEMAEKQARTEFMSVMGTTLQQLGALVTAQPRAAPFAAEVLKFALAPFRAGRELETAIEEFADQMVNAVQQPSPEAQAAQAQAQAEQQRFQAEIQIKAQELQAKLQESEMKGQIEREKAQSEMQSRQQENDAKLAQINAQMERDRQKGELEVQKLQMELQAKREELDIKREAAQIDAAAKVQQADIAAQSAEQQADIKANQAEQQAEQSERAFEQKAALNAQQAKVKNGAANNTSR